MADSEPRVTRWLACGVGVLPVLVLIGWALLDRLPGPSDPGIILHAENTAVQHKPHFPTHIRQPDGPPTILTSVLDPAGQPASVSCSTCHTTREPDRLIQEAEQLEDFHTGLTFEHGDSSCLTCHNDDDYDTLRLADGRVVEYTDVMNLCAQCHGPQYRDYSHGSHGGMTGYWDTTRGERQRNNCIDCHDSHAPKYPAVQPVFPPRDRAVTQQHEADHD